MCVYVACYEKYLRVCCLLWITTEEKHITTSYGRTLHRSMFALKICYSPIPNTLIAYAATTVSDGVFLNYGWFQNVHQPRIKILLDKNSIEWAWSLKNAAKLNLILTSSESQCFCTISIPEEMLEVVTAGLKRALCKLV